MNNFEKIKSMNLNEMAELIKNGDCGYCLARDLCKIWTLEEPYTLNECNKAAKKWLESEVIE